MNILIGESTELAGNYSLFTETQVLSLTWQADPVKATLTSLRDGKELVILRSGQVMKTTTSTTASPQGNEVVTTQSVPDPDATVKKAVEVINTFKEAVAMLGKSKVVDRSDLNAFNIAEALNAAPEPETPQDAEAPETTEESA